MRKVKKENIVKASDAPRPVKINAKTLRALQAASLIFGAQMMVLVEQCVAAELPRKLAKAKNISTNERKMLQEYIAALEK